LRILFGEGEEKAKIETLIIIKTGASGGLPWTPQWNLGFHKRWKLHDEFSR